MRIFDFHLHPGYDFHAPKLEHAAFTAPLKQEGIVKCCGNYFFTAKNKPAHGVHFLQWCGFPVGNAVCFVFEHPKTGYDNETQTAYTVVALENLMIDDKRNLIYKKHEMWELSSQYESPAEVQAAFVGVFDDIMVCEENVVFN